MAREKEALEKAVARKVKEEARAKSKDRRDYFVWDDDDVVFEDG